MTHLVDATVGEAADTLAGSIYATEAKGLDGQAINEKRRKRLNSACLNKPEYLCRLMSTVAPLANGNIRGLLHENDASKQR